MYSSKYLFSKIVVLHLKLFIFKFLYDIKYKNIYFWNEYKFDILSLVDGFYILIRQLFSVFPLNGK